MLETQFFKQNGWLEWGGALGMGWSTVFAIAVALAAAWFWHRQLRALSPGRRRVLAGLRILVLVLIAFLLLQPTLVHPITEKSEQVVAVLYDDSSSMRVTDADGKSRADRVAQALAKNAADFDLELGARFHVLDYAFGPRIRPINNREQLTYAANETRILDALTQSIRDLENLSVSAVVVISDGAQQESPVEADWQALATAGVPVYTVGVGESEWRDLAIGDIALSRGFFDDAPARITAQFTASGLTGAHVVAEVLHDGVVQISEERLIDQVEQEQQIQLDVVPRTREWLDYTVRVRLKDGLDPTASPEFVAENNEGAVLLDHRKKAYRILYFTGRPNWQYKFVRHALAADPELHLSSLIRVSGAQKEFVFQGRESSLTNPLFEGFLDESEVPRYDEAVFMRMGLDEGELADGYPITPEALYPFHLIIWSDIEAEFFAPAHMRVTRDAVAERGASFLMLGGPHTLGSNDYDSTLIESMLPVMPHTRTTPMPHVDRSAASVTSTPEGFLTGVSALNPDTETNARSWEELPPLPDVDSLPTPRIGASVLANAVFAGDTDPSPFLVQQRFGKGKSAILATGETWPWHLQTPDDNSNHERLWRQWVRSLVSSVPEQVGLEVTPPTQVVGSEVNLAWTVNDEQFKPLEGASLTARVTGPGGVALNVPLVERLDEPGVYEGRFTPDALGKHLVVLEGADASGEARTPVESAILVRADTREASNARFNPALLRQIAERSGGGYFALEDLSQVARAITTADQEHASVERHPIWHHPLFYTLLAAALCAEWTLRRRWGNA